MTGIILHHLCVFQCDSDLITLISFTHIYSYIRLITVMCDVSVIHFNKYIVWEQNNNTPLIQFNNFSLWWILCYTARTKIKLIWYILNIGIQVTYQAAATTIQNTIQLQNLQFLQ